MKFHLTETVIEVALQKIQGPNATVKHLSEILEDDFNQSVENIEVLRDVLSIDPDDLEDLYCNSVLARERIQKWEDRFRVYSEPWYDTFYRLRIYAFMIYNNHTAFLHYLRVWDSDPRLSHRLTEYYVEDGIITLVFDTLEE